METPGGNDTVDNGKIGNAKPPVMPKETKKALDKALGHVLTKGHSIKLHDGDIVITCSEPGFRRAGMEHPHMKVHPEGSLTETQLKMLRAEPKISVIKIGG
ncbi:HI1506-related protein [Gluconobacter japonicus]|uniref:HI1506-related protein n=1 Tax=Gluconobacter japonicus TaxID=376620 RepID=UPI0039E9829D